MKTNRKFYAAHSYMGLNYVYSAPCWKVLVFDNRKERNDWVNENEYSQDTGNYVAMACSRKTANKIKNWM